ERQLMEGLIVHSANNFATLLAEMVAGSKKAMVADMNADAAALKLADTRYADVSGIDPASSSTAQSQLALAVRLLANRTFAEIADMTSVTLPVAGS
ncbi:MAG TPA: hypothetical protein VKT18_00385, partial [Acidimicrobiales bacterium]|nr:hypothetical protein [Acidimicrobiales bacterium]